MTQEVFGYISVVAEGLLPIAVGFALVMILGIALKRTERQ